MTDVPSITDAMTPAEAYVKRLLVARVVATAEGIDALADLADAARTTMAALQAPAPRVPRFAVLSARLADLRDSLPEARLAFEEPLEFAEIEYDAFKGFVATGATDDEVATWIEKRARKRPRSEIIAWNNKERDLRLSDLPAELQEYMEDYIPKCVPRNRPVYHWYDVYDLEEGRI